MPYSFNPLSGLGLDQSIPLDGAGKIPSDYLPSYVDDVVEYANLAGFPATGETGKIYVAIDTGFTYRWSGSVYIQINSLTGTFAADAGTAAAPSISIGTADNGLYAPAEDQVAISTNGTGRLFVDASGNVGVGGVPTANGRLRINVDSGNNANLIFSEGGTDRYLLGQVTSDNALRVFDLVAVSERLRITSDGKLGLGTSSPGTLLELSASNNAGSSNNTLRFTDTDGSSGTDQQTGKIEFYTSDVSQVGVQAYILGAAENASGAGGLRFGTGVAGSALERLRITNTGNVGISVTSPSSLLHLADAGNITVGTTTGTKIGTATSQKIGFYNATPVVQPTTGVAEAAFVENSGGTAVNVDSTFGGYTIQQVVQALQTLGLLA